MSERARPVEQQRGAVQCDVCGCWFRSRGGLAVLRCLPERERLPLLLNHLLHLRHCTAPFCFFTGLSLSTSHSAAWVALCDCLAVHKCCPGASFRYPFQLGGPRDQIFGSGKQGQGVCVCVCM